MHASVHTSIVQRWSLAPIDPRSVFVAYVWIAGVIGATILGTGIRGIPGVPLLQASAVWLSGAILIAFACAALGLTLVDDMRLRRRALRYFASGHIMVGAFLGFQWPVIWRSVGMPLWVALCPLVLGALLVSLSMWSVEPEAADTHALAHVTGGGRTSYTDHIRRVARREERARLARDLHDAVKQQLFVAHTAAATAQARLDSDPAGTRLALEHVRAAAREATTEMEALLEELQASPIENTGLVEAVKKQCDALGFRIGADVRFAPTVLPSHDRMPPGTHETVYRVAQEGLANIGRHARATVVTVSIGTERDRLVLRISDNGVGFAAGSTPDGMGTRNMRARANEIGGHLTIHSSPSGTNIELLVPLRSAARQAALAKTWLIGVIWLSSTLFWSLRGSLDRWALTFLGVVTLYSIASIVDGYRRERRQAAR